VDPKANAGVLALGEQGCPRAVWSREGVWYGERTAQGWTMERVSQDSFGVGDEPLALLPDGRPLLLYGAAAMRFATR
jgi:hypothetical protein